MAQNNGLLYCIDIILFVALYYVHIKIWPLLFWVLRKHTWHQYKKMALSMLDVCDCWHDSGGGSCMCFNSYMSPHKNLGSIFMLIKTPWKFWNIHELKNLAKANVNWKKNSIFVALKQHWAIMTNVTFPQLIQRGCCIDVHLKVVVVVTIHGVGIPRRLALLTPSWVVWQKWKNGC